MVLEGHGGPVTMKMRLTRTDHKASGIFGAIEPEDEAFLLLTGEHAYLDHQVDHHEYYLPKVPLGTYICVRGLHRLAHMTEDFETFEVTGVEGHTDILFHSGNYPQVDSAGCILLGLASDFNTEVTHSKLAFERFMEYLEGVDEFTLEVV